MTPAFRDRLGTRIIGTVTLIVLALALSTGGLVLMGADRILDHAAQESEEALLERGTASLADITAREARLIDAHLQRMGAVALQAADMVRVGLASDMPALAELPSGRDERGYGFDASPATSDLFFPASLPASELRRDVEASRILDSMFARWSERHPDIGSIYFDGAAGVTRYYPPIGLHEHAPDHFDFEVFVEGWTSRVEALPEDGIWWSSPYLDSAGLGLTVSARAAVRSDGRIIGSTGIDITLSDLQERLSAVLLSPASRALLIDGTGRLVAGAGPGAPAATDEPPAIDALLRAAGLPPDALEQIARDETGTVAELSTAEGGLMLASLAGLPDLGWQLLQLQPREDLVAPSARLMQDIRNQAGAVWRTVLGLTVTLLLVGLLALALFNHWSLLRPIAALTRATREIASGNYRHRVAHGTRDELGLLASHFDTMAERLQESSARYRTLFDEAGDGILLHRDGIITEANACAAELLGRSATSLPGTSLTSLRTQNAAVPTDAGTSYERWRRHDGSTFWADISESEIPLPSGPVQQLLVRDATAAVEARERLEEAVEQRTGDLRTLLELSNRAALSSGADAAENLVQRLGEVLQRDVTLVSPADVREVEGAFVLPCSVGGRTAGALLVDVEQRALGSNELALARAFATQIGVALESARLTEELQEMAVLEERHRLARELHDSVSQALFGIALGTKAALSDLPEGSAARQALDYSLQLTQGGLAEMRALIFELRPESLEREGLVAALLRQGEVLRRRHGLAVEEDLEGDPDVPLDVKQAVYRIAQEAMHNMAKHAHATNARIVLRCRDGRWRLTVSDDGRGFDPSHDFAGHLGLVSMRERAETHGLFHRIASSPGTGTSVEVAFGGDRAD